MQIDQQLVQVFINLDSKVNAIYLDFVERFRFLV